MKFDYTNSMNESELPRNTDKILDHVIAIQLDKIEKNHANSKTRLTDSSEYAMANMIELLKMRYDKKPKY